MSTLLLAGLSLAGCGTVGGVRDAGRDASQLAYPARPSTATPIIATRAQLVSDTRLHIDYHDGTADFSVAVALPTGTQPTAVEAPAGQAPRPPIVPFVPAAPGAVPTAAPDAVAIRSPQDWQSLVRRLQHELAAQVPSRGVVLDVLRQADLFLYVDDEGELQAVPLEEKPAAIEPTQVITLTALLTNAIERVRNGLRTRGDATRYLLFNTADAPDTGFPFVLMDLQGDRVLFLQRVADSAQVEALGPSLAAQAAFHALTSQLFSLSGRPVSSFTRLLSSVGSAVIDPPWLPPALGGDDPPPPLADAPPMDPDAWERTLDELVGGASHGRLDYLVDGDAFFPALIHALGQARESIRMRLYIFDNDDYALKIADLLKARSREVRVEVLVDGLGTLTGGLAQADYRPEHARRRPASIVAYLREGSDVRVRVVSNPWLQGDHTKVIVIDDREAFVGGMNIGREYRYEWHDLMVRVQGPVVDQLIRDFDNAWVHEGLFGDLQALLRRARQPVREPGDDDVPMRLLYTRPGDAQILRAQVAALRRAQQRVWLQNAYLTSDTILHELIEARGRGVDVRVILPYRTDAGLIGRSNVLAANLLLRRGVRVYVYPGMSHVKAAVYDGWACLGSANFDRLSLRLNKETNIATSHAAVVEQLVDRVFAADFAHSVELREPLPSGWLDYLRELIADQL